MLFFCLLCAKSSLGQVADNFNSSVLEAWTANDFKISDGQLQSNFLNTNASFYTSIPNKLASNCIWEFWVNLKFNTSNSNYVDVYLISNQANLKSSSIDGYFLRIGGTADELSLYKRKGSLANSVKITDGQNGVTNKSNSILKVKIERDEEGKFEVYYDLSATGNMYVKDGEVIDAEFMTTDYFGFYIQQSTTTFIGKHYFDDVSVREFVVDRDAPKLVSIERTDSIFNITFSESVTHESALNPQNYLFYPALSNEVKIRTTSNSTTIQLVFSPKESTNNYEMQIFNISDLAGNVLEITPVFHFFHIGVYEVKWSDVRINELMVDPSPPLGLPNAEYIELWNQTDQYISLSNWKLKSNNSIQNFPADTLAPNAIVILTSKANEQLFKGFGKVVGFASWPALRNESGVVSVLSNTEQVIDSINYDLRFYKENRKKEGGFSLELIDPLNRCEGLTNWQGSISESGGSPGEKNSVYQIHLSALAPKLLSVEFEAENTIGLKFDSELDAKFAEQVANYTVNNGLGSPIKATISREDYSSVRLIFSENIRTGLEYQVQVKGLRNCGGLALDAVHSRGHFFRSKVIESSDLLITEILMDPKSGGSDFLEVYNNSVEILNLKGLKIANESVDGQAASYREFTSNILIAPQEYLVFTNNVQFLKDMYYLKYPRAVIPFALPAFAQAQGGVFLIYQDKQIDYLRYKQSYHHPLITHMKGVSLERISLKRETNSVGNFASASASAGYATPGYENSVSDKSVNSMLKLDNPIIYLSKGSSELGITLELAEKGVVGTLKIFDDRGNWIQTLLNNVILGNFGEIKWDIKNLNSRKASKGIYHLVLEYFDMEGRNYRIVKSFVIA